MQVLIIVIIIFIIISLISKMVTVKSHSDVVNNPEIKRRIYDPLERWGRFDGSAAQRKKADDAFNIIKNNIGTSGPHTREIYENVLKSTRLLIPIAATYSFAVGEFINNPYVTLQNINSKEAREKVAAMRALFPALYEYATTSLSPTKAESALIISMNLLDLFLSK